MARELWHRDGRTTAGVHPGWRWWRKLRPERLATAERAGAISTMMSEMRAPVEARSCARRRAVSRIVVALVCSAFCIGSASLSPTAFAATKSCPGERVTHPSEGYGSIIAALRVSGVTCATGFRIADRHGSGARLPRGWKCKTNIRTICRRGRAHVSWVFAGDAG